MGHILTRLNRWMGAIIKVIKPLIGYDPLEQKFFQESERVFRVILRWAGVYLCLINLVLIAVDYATLAPHKFQYLLVSHLVEFCFGILLVIWAYRIKDLIQLYRYVMAGMILDTFNICLGTFLIQDVLMTALFLIATIIAMLIFPWPIQYTIGVELSVIVYSFLFFPYFSYENITTSPTFLITLCVSAAIVITAVNGVLINQRWQNFLRRHEIRQLNQKLEIFNF